jgi:hypothetical protein
MFFFVSLITLSRRGNMDIDMRVKKKAWVSKYQDHNAPTRGEPLHLSLTIKHCLPLSENRSSASVSLIFSPHWQVVSCTLFVVPCMCSAISFIMSLSHLDHGLPLVIITRFPLSLKAAASIRVGGDEYGTDQASRDQRNRTYY